MTTLFSLLTLFIAHNIGLSIKVPEALYYSFIFALPLLLLLAYPLFSLAISEASSLITPKLISTLRQDRWIRYLSRALFIYPIFGVLLINAPYTDKTLLIYLAIGIDSASMLMRRKSAYMDPFYFLDRLFLEVSGDAQKNDERGFCSGLGAIGELSEKALDEGFISLCLAAIQSEEKAIREFLGIKMLPGQVTTDPSTHFDYLSYTLFFLFQRQEELFVRALEKKSETVLTHIITSFGKTALAAAEVDYSLISYPIHYLGNCSLSAIKKGFREVGVKAVITLREVSKQLLENPKATGCDLEDPFLAIIAQQELLAKELFRQDKATDLNILTQPFRELSEIISGNKFSAHQHKEPILQRLNQILIEFSALESVLRTLPPIPSPTEEEKGTELRV